jgi:hypothetical protein
VRSEGFYVNEKIPVTPAGIDVINTHRSSRRTPVILTDFGKKRCKVVPLQTSSGPEGSRKLRFPDFVTTAQDVGKVVSLTYRPPLHPRKCSWYSFLLEAESNPGPYCDRKDYVNEKIPVTPSGIEPSTFRLVALRLNYCATAVPV